MWHQAVKGKCVRGFRVSCLPTQIITRIRCETGGLTWGFGSPKGSGADLAVQHVRLAVFDPFPKFALRYDAHMTQWAYERAPAKHVPACLRACASRSQACTVPQVVPCQVLASHELAKRSVAKRSFAKRSLARRSLAKRSLAKRSLAKRSLPKRLRGATLHTVPLASGPLACKPLPVVP